MSMKWVHAAAVARATGNDDRWVDVGHRGLFCAVVHRAIEDLRYLGAVHPKDLYLGHEALAWCLSEEDRGWREQVEQFAGLGRGVVSRMARRFLEDEIEPLAIMALPRELKALVRSDP